MPVLHQYISQTPFWGITIYHKPFCPRWKGQQRSKSEPLLQFSKACFTFFRPNHYKISQFYQRKYSVGVWLPVRRWFIYRRLHRRITSVGFPFVGNSTFCRYIGRKHKKTICRWFYRRNLCAKKKFPAWNIPINFIPSVISWFIDSYLPSVNLSVSVWNTDRIYPSINSSVIVAATVKCWRIHSVGKAVGECMKYRPNISIYKCVGECGSYLQMPTDSFRR